MCFPPWGGGECCARIADNEQGAEGGIYLVNLRKVNLWCWLMYIQSALSRNGVRG